MMSTRVVRSSSLRSYRRRRIVMNLDLNSPPVENPEQEGTSNQATSQLMMDSVATVDIEAIDDDADDDIVFCSPSTFAEAKKKSQRNCGRATVVDVDSAEEMTRGHKRRRGPASQSVIDFGLLINLESSRSSMVPEEKPTPPKEPAFSCPICMGPLVEETSTKCGHIFCKACIRAAIATQAKCPTCRKRVTVKDLIRVFLPATNAV